jgi:hypothetical protein
LNDRERQLLEGLVVTVARMEATMDRLDRDATRRALEDDRRAMGAARQARWRESRRHSNVDNNVDCNVYNNAPSPFSPLPFPAPLSLSPLSPPQEQKPSAASDEKAIAAPPETLSEFSTYLQSEWPDIKRPWEYERRAQAAFPGVSLAAEARKARGWECSNPKHAKRNHGRFLWGWLTRAQDGASRTAAPVFHIEALAKARADEVAEKQRRETQILLEKQQAERPDRTPPEEAKRRLAALANKVLANKASE